MNTLKNKQRMQEQQNIEIELQPNPFGNMFNFNEKDNKKFISMPFIPNLSIKIQRMLKKHSINVCYKNHNTLNKLFSKIKDKTETLMETNTIYDIKCKKCNVHYIGQSKQYLKNRIKQHKDSTKNRNLADEYFKTALAEHTLKNLHNFDFEEITILHKEENPQKRNILEMIEITKQVNAINYRQDTEGLKQIYKTIIKPI